MVLVEVTTGRPDSAELAPAPLALVALAELFGVADPARITLTKNATEALNLAIFGLVCPGDRVVATGMEHNAVMRPLRHLEAQGVALPWCAGRCGQPGGWW